MPKPVRAGRKYSLPQQIRRLHWLCCCVPMLGAADEAVDTARYDWVPVTELSAEQKQKLTHTCSGAYIDPLADHDASEDPALAPIYVEAGRSNMETEQIVLDGDVQISQGPRRIAADYMFYNRRTEQAALEGNVEIRQPGMLVRGTGGEVNMAGEEARFEGGEFVLHNDHLRGSAGLIEHRPGGIVALEDGALTSCEPGHEAWLLKGERLRIDPVRNQGSGRNVTVEVGGFPVLYVPYFRFPLGDQRQTGLLLPVVGTSNSGVDITVPWYWNIAPNYDATIAPRYASGHGAMLETEWRYLNRQSMNTLSLAVLPNDKGGADPDAELAIDEEDIRRYRGEERWLLGLQHQGGDDSRWYSSIDFAKVSDVDYFKDLTPESFELSNNTSLGQGALLGYRLPNWNLSARLQTYQNLLVDLDPNYQQLPRVQMNGRYSWDTLQLHLDHEWAYFDHRDESYVQGQRARLDYQLQWNKHWLWGFVRPSVGVQGLGYDLNEDNLNAQADPRVTLAAPYASLDTGLIFERDGGRHTLEPRLFYLNRGHVDHSDLYGVTNDSFGPVRDVNFDTTLLTFSYDQLFRDRRFVGGDRIGDTNQLTLGVTSQWLDADRAQPLAAVSLGQVMYFDDREVTVSGEERRQTLEESDLAGKVMAQVNSKIKLRSDFLYNPDSERVMRATTGISYNDLGDRHFKIDYRYVRDERLAQSTLPVNQLDSAFSMPVHEQWQVVGRLFYDLDANRELDAFLGFEYDDCCYRVRLLARRWLDSKLAELVNDDEPRHDVGVFFEVDLKGLASSGQKIQRLLSESLPDFQNY